MTLTCKGACRANASEAAFVRSSAHRVGLSVSRRRGSGSGQAPAGEDQPADDHDGDDEPMIAGASGSEPTSSPSAPAIPSVAWRIDRKRVPSRRPGEDALPDEGVGEPDDERPSGEHAERREADGVRRPAGEAATAKPTIVRPTRRRPPSSRPVTTIGGHDEDRREDRGDDALASAVRQRAIGLTSRKTASRPRSRSRSPPVPTTRATSGRTFRMHERVEDLGRVGPPAARAG